LGGTKEIWGHCPQMPPRDYGPVAVASIVQ